MVGHQCLKNLSAHSAAAFIKSFHLQLVKKLG
jgi:hypothetical protein